MAAKSKDKFRVKRGDPRHKSDGKINRSFHVMNEFRYIWYLCLDCVPGMLASNLCWC